MNRQPPAIPAPTLHDILADLATPEGRAGLEETLFTMNPGRDLLLFDRVADCPTNTERRVYLGHLQAHFSGTSR